MITIRRDVTIEQLDSMSIVASVKCIDIHELLYKEMDAISRMTVWEDDDILSEIATRAHKIEAIAMELIEARKDFETVREKIVQMKKAGV